MFTVTIKRTITTTVSVSNASSAADARRIVEEYGVVEAISDLPVISEDIDVRISRATRYDRSDMERGLATGT